MSYDGDAISEQEWGAMDDYGYESDYSNDFVKSVVRKSSLHCSTCKTPIKKGDRAVFELDHGKFEGVHCMGCYAKDDRMRVSMEDQRHPFDLEATE